MRKKEEKVSICKIIVFREKQCECLGVILYSHFDQISSLEPSGLHGDGSAPIRPWAGVPGTEISQVARNT